MTFPTPAAFSPGSVSCFFSPSISTAPEQTFSRGFAINLSDGVTAAVRPATAGRYLLNGRPVQIGPVDDVIARLAPEPVELHFETPLRPGCGFGVSAACCLTAAFAIARRYDLAMSRTELGMIAHVAEVRRRTGIGDVASQLCGGFVYRVCRTGPLDSRQLPLPHEPLYYRVFGEVRTADVLAAAPVVQRIAREGQDAIAWLERNLNDLTLKSLFDRSLAFARATGLLAAPPVITAIEDVITAGGAATMVMLGQTVLSTTPVPPEASWAKCSVDAEGTRWLP